VWRAAVLGGRELAALRPMPIDAADILRRAALAGDIRADTTSLAHGDLLELRVELWRYAPSAERWWRFQDNVTAYDGTYVALAELLDAPLATLDQRPLPHPVLAAAPRPRARTVVRLGRGGHPRIGAGLHSGCRVSRVRAKVAVHPIGARSGRSPNGATVDDDTIRHEIFTRYAEHLVPEAFVTPTRAFRVSVQDAGPVHAGGAQARARFDRRRRSAMGSTARSPTCRRRSSRIASTGHPRRPPRHRAPSRSPARHDHGATAGRVAGRGTRRALTIAALLGATLPRRC
jgi:predicted nucleic acid-binding protein